MDQGGKDVNRERDYSQIATSRQAGTRDDSAQRQSFPAGETLRLRSLIIDGHTAHARLRLPVRLPGSGLGTSEIPIAAMLTGYPPAGEPDDLQPREGDLLPFTFRLISAVYLGGGGYHLDFSRDGVLEGALPLFLEPEVEGSARQDPLIVVRDHSFVIEDRIGLVCGAQWSPADPSADGQGLPHPGIDAELHINWKLAGDVVRRLLHDPPLLDACSVSLGFNWEKSHPGLEDWQFWSCLGEELDGSPVRVVVSEILTVEHVGLVFTGADPSARRAGSSAKRREQASIETDGVVMTASLSKGPAAGEINEGGQPQMEANSITLTPDSTLWGLLGMEQPDGILLEQRVAELKGLAELGREALADLRREVSELIVRLDGAVESEPSRGLLNVVQAADMTTLRALKEEYARRLETLMPARCQVCGSEQVSRRSSRETSLTDGAREDDDPGLYR